MKKILYLFMTSSLLFAASCSSDDDQNEPDSANSVFTLESRANAAISGDVTFTDNQNGSTTVVIDLNGTTTGSHPAHIHENSAVEGGDIIVSLEPVDATTGLSTTVVSTLNDGTAISYEQLVALDAYVNVHQSADDLGTLIAQGDIGVNILTGDTKEYTLNSKAIPSIDGIATFSKRVSGATLVEIELNGTPDGGQHPAHIHFNTAAEGGEIAVSLTTVDGTSGSSSTHIEELNDGTTINYEGLLEFDGYINVHLSAADLGTLVAQGDIGQNELTGNNVDYDLAAVSDATIFGTANFAERVNGETLVTVNLVGTTAGNLHPAHIHSGDVENAPGAIIVSLGNVVGETGISVTNVTELNDGTSLDYSAMTQIDGYINVHLSADDLATLVAQGNVGANAN